MKKKVLFITQGALIAALYVVLTLLIDAFNLANGQIQVRISEALCVLPFFTPAAVPGLGLGCLIANLVMGNALPDVIFGTYLLRKHKFLCTLPPVISNAIIIPLVLRYAYGFTFEFKGMDLSITFFMLTVGIGEIISVCILGTVLRKALLPVRQYIFKTEN